MTATSCFRTAGPFPPPVLAAVREQREPRYASLRIWDAARSLCATQSTLITSALVQYAPAPTHLIWWALLAVFAAGTVAVLAIAEPGARRPGALASLRPTIAVPRQARRTFAGAVPCFVATWALGGLYLSLGPSLAAAATGSGAFRKHSGADRWPGNHEVRAALDGPGLLRFARRPGHGGGRDPAVRPCRQPRPGSPSLACGHAARPLHRSAIPAGHRPIGRQPGHPRSRLRR